MLQAKILTYCTSQVPVFALFISLRTPLFSSQLRIWWKKKKKKKSHSGFKISQTELYNFASLRMRGSTDIQMNRLKPELECHLVQQHSFESKNSEYKIQIISYVCSPDVIWIQPVFPATVWLWDVMLLALWQMKPWLSESFRVSLLAL